MRRSRISVITAQRVRRLTVAMALIGAAACSYAADPKASKFFEDALVRYEKKDMDGAIIQLKNALQIDPKMLPVQVLLGKALLRNGQAAASEVAFLEAVRLGVNRAEVVIPLTQAYVAQGKQKLIFGQQQFILAGLPPAVQLELLLLRAAASSDLGDVRGALKSIEDARAIDAKSPDVWLAEVPLRIRTRQLKEAIAAVDRAMALAPNSGEVWYQQASILHVMGNIKGALSAYDKALATDAAHVEARIARAGIYIDLGRASDASKDLNTLKSMAPREPRSAYLRALLAERSNDTVASNAALKEVTNLMDPVPMDFIRYRPQFLMLNGLAHFGLGQGEKAKQYLLAFQRVQGNSPASKLLGQLLLAEPNVPSAIEVLEGYLKAQPADAQAMTLLASAYISLGRNAKATAIMQEALKAQDTPEMRTILGISMIRGGQGTEGVNELESVFRKTNGQIQAGLNLLSIYMRSGQAAKAISVAESLVKQYPQNASFFNLLGMARGQAGNLGEARTAFEQALKLDEGQVPVKLNLARLEIASKAYDAAAVRLAAILKADEKNAEAMYEMSVISDRSGKPSETQRWLEKANDLSGPKEVRWGLALLNYFLRTGQSDLAMQAAKRMSAKAPEDLEVLLAYARAQLAIGDPIGAKSTLNGATRFADYNAPRQVNIALLQLAANNIDGATYSLEKALSGQPDFLPAQAAMTDVELRRNDPTKAEKRAREIVAKNPRRAVGYSLLGDVARARGQSTAATDNYRRAHLTEPSSDTLLQLFGALSSQDGGKPAIQLAEQWIKAHPRDIAVRKAISGGYVRAGNFTLARSNYEEVAKLAPEDASVLNNLANVLSRLKDPAAVKTAELAMTKAPTNGTVADTLGWILFQNGQTERALQLLRDARLREPGNPEIRFHLATVLAQLGRKNEARGELDSALKGGTSFESAADAQKLLKTLSEGSE